jgi:hypothetical protein
MGPTDASLASNRPSDCYLEQRCCVAVPKGIVKVCSWLPFPEKEYEPWVRL